MKDSIDTQKLTIVEKEVFGDWENLIVENDGDYSQSEQWINFQLGDYSIDVTFRLRITGDFYYLPESYLQPSEGEVNILSVEVLIEDFTINSEKITNREVISDMEKSISELLSIDNSLL